MNKEQVIALINSAFETVPDPGKDSITGCSCAECLEIREDFAGKQPEELEDDRMRFHSWDMGFFTPEARHYYLPGWMRLGITQPKSNCIDAVIQILGYSKGWDPPGGFTAVQRRAIFEFLKLIKTRENRCGDLDFDIAWDEWATDSESDAPNEESEQFAPPDGP
jgi:hypothetical protein